MLKTLNVEACREQFRVSSDAFQLHRTADTLALA